MLFHSSLLRSLTSLLILLTTFVSLSTPISQPDSSSSFSSPSSIPSSPLSLSLLPSLLSPSSPLSFSLFPLPFLSASSASASASSDSSKKNKKNKKSKEKKKKKSKSNDKDNEDNEKDKDSDSGNEKVKDNVKEKEKEKDKEGAKDGKGKEKAKDTAKVKEEKVKDEKPKEKEKLKEKEKVKEREVPPPPPSSPKSEEKEKEKEKEKVPSKSSSTSSPPPSSSSTPKSSSKDSKSSTSPSSSSSSSTSRVQSRLRRSSATNDSLRKRRQQRSVNRHKRRDVKFRSRLSFIESQFNVTSNTAIAKGMKAAQWMEKQYQKSKSKTLSLNTQEFNQYVYDTPRYYSALLIITALSSEHKCEVCTQVATTQRKLSKMYNEQYGDNETNSENHQVGKDEKYHHDLRHITKSEYTSTIQRIFSSPSQLKNHPNQDSLSSSVKSLSDDEWREVESSIREQLESYKKSLPFYFIELDMKNNRDLFYALEIQTAPQIFFLPSTFNIYKEGKESVNKGWLQFIGGKNKYNAMTNSHGVKEIGEWINNFMGGKIDITEDESEEDIAEGTKATSKKNIKLGDDTFESASRNVGKLFKMIKSKWNSVDIYSQRLVKIVASVCVLAFIYNISLYIYYKFILKREDFYLLTSPTHLTDSSHISRILSASSLPSLTPNRFFLLLLSYLFYLFTSGGGMYNIIRGSDLHNNNNYWDYHSNIVNRQGEQYVVESFIVGGFHIALGAGIVLLNLRAWQKRKIVVETKEKENDNSEGKRQNISLPIHYRIWLFFDTYLLSLLLNPFFILITLWFLYREFVLCYTTKNSHYLSHIITQLERTGIIDWMVRKFPKWAWKAWKWVRVFGLSHPTQWTVKYAMEIGGNMINGQEIYNFFMK